MSTHAMHVTPAPDGAKRSGRKKLIVAVAAVLMVAGLAGGWAARRQIKALFVTPAAPGTHCTDLSVAEHVYFDFTPDEQSGTHKITDPIKARLLAEGRTLDPATINDKTITLRRVKDLMKVEGTVELDREKTTIILTPSKPLDPQTNYWFAIANGVKDSKGDVVAPYQIAFDTGPAGALDAPKFEQVALPDTVAMGITCVTVKYGKLWASVDDGRILRWTINPDGTLGPREAFPALLRDINGKKHPRLIGGFTFDPSSTPEHPVLWVTHTSFGFINMDDWQGKLARISGPKLDKIEDILTNLPRSARDHVIHQPSFGPDGGLYFQSGSMSSYGDPDGFWGMRKEHPFAAAVVRVDTNRLPPNLPIDLKTPEDGGSYQWRDPNQPVQVWAYGIRVVYDLNWHSNGHMYAPTNGSCAGGNSPAGSGAPALKNIPDAEHDWLFRVEKGGYYGHPNPSQGYFVLNGGNPTAEGDYAECPHYPIGTQPEKDWKPAIYSFGNHVSANGSTEYFTDGPLKNSLIVCRYNMGSDLIALKFDEKGDVKQVIDGVEGWENLRNPLDVCEDPETGNLYVSEYGRQLTLIRLKK